MTDFRFVVNLRPETITGDFVQRLRPPGWLAAPGNTTPATRSFAAAAARRGRQFVADNGNFARLGDLLADHAEAAADLRRQVTEIEARLDRTARRADLPPDLRAAYDGLVATVADEAQRRVPLPLELLAAQLPLGATRVIGVEDLTAAAVLSLDGEPHLIGWNRRSWRRRNELVAAEAQRVLADHPELAGSYYPVAGALDWGAAYDAGRTFAGAGLTRAAMGFGAYMADDHSTDFLVVGGRTIRLPGRYPQRYLRTAAVASGFFEGYRAVAGRPPEGFHFLGLGAPTMMAVAAVAADGTDHVSFDATSPMRDAAEGTLYVAKPALLKIRARRVAERMAFRGGGWGCPCSFCRAFLAEHPWDLPAARAWGALRSEPVVSAADLRPGGGLFDALPLLSEPGHGPLRGRVNATRMGHNHWVLQQLCRQLERAPDVTTLVAALVDRYVAATNSPTAGEAVRLAFDLVSRRRGPG